MAGKPQRSGSKPGERRGGRTKGVPNKMTGELKEICHQYTPAAIQELVRLSTEAKSESTRIQAIGMLLDRAYGRPVQPIDGDGKGGAIPIRNVTDEERLRALMVLLQKLKFSA